MTYNYRDTLSDEDREIYDRMAAEKAANREANRATIEAAGVPRAALRGVYRACDNNSYRIRDITEYPVEGRASRWGVTTELYAGSHTSYGWLIGPRGKAKKVW